MKGRSAFITGLRLTLAVVFAYSALAKLAAPPPPAHYFATFTPLVAAVEPYAVALLPWLELALAALLLTGTFVPLAAGSCVCCAVLFLAVIVMNAGRDEFIRNCGCFGASASLGSRASSRFHVIALLTRASVIGLAASLLWLRTRARFHSGRALCCWLITLHVATCCALLVRGRVDDERARSARVLSARKERLLLRPRFDGVRPLASRDVWLAPYGKRLVATVFFSSSCGICRAHAEAWPRLITAWADEIELRFIAPQADRGVAAFVQKYRLPVDAVGMADDETLRYFGVDAYPEILLFDAAGVVVWRSALWFGPGAALWLGYLHRTGSERTFSRAIETLLDGTLAEGLRYEIYRDGASGAGQLFRITQAGRIWGCGELLQVAPGMVGVSELNAIHVTDTGGHTIALVPIPPFRVYGRVVDLAEPLKSVAGGASLDEAFGTLPEAPLLAHLVRALDRDLAASRAQLGAAGAGE